MTTVAQTDSQMTTTIDRDLDKCSSCNREAPWEIIEIHKKHCRKVKCLDQEMTICLFDALHTVPMSEGLEHHQTCPKRHGVSEAWMQEQMKGWETADADQKMRGLSLESKDPASKPVSKITDTGKSNANVATFNSFPPIYMHQLQCPQAASRFGQRRFPK